MSSSSSIFDALVERVGPQFSCEKSLPSLLTEVLRLHGMGGDPNFIDTTTGKSVIHFATHLSTTHLGLSSLVTALVSHCQANVNMESLRSRMTPLEMAMERIGLEREFPGAVETVLALIATGRCDVQRHAAAVKRCTVGAVGRAWAAMVEKTLVSRAPAATRTQQQQQQGPKNASVESPAPAPPEEAFETQQNPQQNLPMSLVARYGPEAGPLLELVRSAAVTELPAEKLVAVMAIANPLDRLRSLIALEDGLPDARLMALVERVLTAREDPVAMWRLARGANAGCTPLVRALGRMDLACAVLTRHLAGGAGVSLAVTDSE